MDQVWSFIVEIIRLIPMKQMTLLVAMLLACGIGSLYNPFWGVLLYYTFSVLRPQYLWNWALPVDVRWSLIAGIIILFGVLANLPKLIFKSNFNIVTNLLITYGILLIISCLLANNPTVTQYWAIEYAKIFTVAIIASLVINQMWQIKVILAMIMLTIGYIAWEVNFGYFVEGRLDIFHYGYGGFDNNTAALFITMGFPLTYGFFMIVQKPIAKMFVGTLAMFILHAILMSYSRGAAVAWGISSVWLLAQHKPRYQSAAFAVILAAAVSVMAGEQIRERLLSTANYANDGSAQQRFTSWRAAWEIAWGSPILGKGIRNSTAIIHKYGAKNNQAVHNQFLQIAADSGFPALIIYLAALIIALFRFAKTRNICQDYLARHKQSGTKDPPDPLARQMVPLALAAQTSLITFAAGGMFVSMEVFELPWLLIILGGVMPDIARKHLETVDTYQPPEPALLRAIRRKRFKRMTRKPYNGILHP